MSRREAWFEGQLDLDPHTLVFIDETGASTKMARLHGRAPRGQRLRASIPHGHWKTTTFIGALRLTGMTAPMVLDGPMTGEWFLAYVDQVLVPSPTSAQSANPCRTNRWRIPRRWAGAILRSRVTSCGTVQPQCQPVGGRLISGE